MPFRSFGHDQAFLLIYPTLVRKPLAVFDCFESPGKKWVLRDDPAEACLEEAWTGWAAAAAIGVLVYGLGMPFVAFTLSRLLRNQSGDARERIALLIDSYRPRFWATETYILAYKFVLTGAIHLLPEPRIQICTPPRIDPKGLLSPG